MGGRNWLLTWLGLAAFPTGSLPLTAAAVSEGILNLRTNKQSWKPGWDPLEGVPYMPDVSGREMTSCSRKSS
ncbi:hypothetical protein AMTR_s00072p00153920 [Amborella trichopoda]|uniref:Uncharacterized protein n=1 Tax=Amborella trichopoda TaxID=13333 RepID=W1NRG0_AMBTC|nr:hypothetical protein AMTR_s00072p00153920 [Amborella trichopoda]